MTEAFLSLTETIFGAPLHVEKSRHKSHYCWRVHKGFSQVSGEYNSQRKQTREFGKILLWNGNYKTSMVQMCKSSYYWMYMLVDLLRHIWAKPVMCRLRDSWRICSTYMKRIAWRVFVHESPCHQKRFALVNDNVVSHEGQWKR